VHRVELLLHKTLPCSYSIVVVNHHRPLGPRAALHSQRLYSQRPFCSCAGLGPGSEAGARGGGGGLLCALRVRLDNCLYCRSTLRFNEIFKTFCSTPTEPGIGPLQRLCGKALRPFGVGRLKSVGNAGIFTALNGF
jgi:hypothetical protein